MLTTNTSRARDYSKLKPDLDNAEPLYLQLAKKMAWAINEGWWSAVDPLPSERTLSMWFKLSRVTTRKALDILTNEGLIYRRPGSGTYLRQSLRQTLDSLKGFTECFGLLGEGPQTFWISKEIAMPTFEQAAQLNISQSEQIVILKRKRLIDGVIVSFEISILPLAFVPKPRDIKHSLYEYLSSQELHLVRAAQKISAMNATEEIAKHTNTQVGRAMLQVNRTSFNELDQVVEFTITYCRTEFYDFVFELRRNL